ncbi:hypothetical protein OH77DRAFT_178430 [Trametes cingulata]|nr:hypothetical protein OH77DRAFT_178430 [Trametes cingulata]
MSNSWCTWDGPCFSCSAWILILSPDRCTSFSSASFRRASRRPRSYEEPAARDVGDTPCPITPAARTNRIPGCYSWAHRLQLFPAALPQCMQPVADLLDIRDHVLPPVAEKKEKHGRQGEIGARNEKRRPETKSNSRIVISRHV